MTALSLLASRAQQAPPSEQLTEDDYFQRNSEFQHWLLEDKGVFFDSIPAEEARKRFRKFAAKWNDGELSSKYYGGLKNAPSASATRTAHKWAFASKLSASDQMQLDSARDTIESQTRKGAPNERFSGHAERMRREQQAARREAGGPGGRDMCLPCGPGAAGAPGVRGPSGPTGPPAAAAAMQSRRSEDARARVAELQAKEQARMDEFKKRMGLK